MHNCKQFVIIEVNGFKLCTLLTELHEEDTRSVPLQTVSLALPSRYTVPCEVKTQTEMHTTGTSKLEFIY
jgi:hypothetical protein